MSKSLARTSQTWAYSASPGCERTYWFVKKWRGTSKSSFVPVALTIQSIESKIWMKSMNSAFYAKWFQRISLVKVWSVISYHIVIKPLYLKRKHACVGKLFRLHWRHSRPIMIGRRCFSRGLMGHSKTTLHRFGSCCLTGFFLVVESIDLKIRQSTIYYPGLLLVSWDKWLVNQASDVPRIIFW